MALPSRVPVRPLQFFALALAGALVLVARSSLGVPYAPHPGKWTPADSLAAIGVQAVHMLLVPDSTQEYAAKIVWWTGEDANPGSRTGGVFGWDPEDLWCGGNVTAALTDDTLLAESGYNIFCAGQIQLPGSGGRVMTIGGTDGDVEIGVTNSSIYRPASNTWVAANGMEYRRWYPSSTVLGSRGGTGSILVSGGSAYPHMLSFGGRPIGSATPDSLLRLCQLTAVGGWDAPHSSSGNHDYPDWWASSRVGHTLTSSGLSSGLAQILFAGMRDTVRSGGGGAVDTVYLNDAYGLNRDENETEADFGYSFNPLTFATELRPDGRAEHAFVPISADSAIVVGGFGAVFGSKAVFNDAWLLTRASNNTWTWTKLTTSGPLRRYDHVGFYDPAHKRLLVFGGRSSLGGSPTDSVWALDLKQISVSGATLTWSRPTISGTPPTGRAGASMMTDPFPRRHTSTSPYFYYGLMFGGQTGSGVSDELWELSVPADTSDYTVSWRQVTLTGSTVPPARHQHVSVKDSRIVIWGGFGTSTNDDAVWAATIPVGDGDVLSATWQADWQQLPTQAPVTGAAAINLGRATFTRESEIFTPSGASGTWEELDDSALLEDYYPMHFLLPDGYVFGAGPRTNSYRMDPSAGEWDSWPPSANATGHWAGSAVQYRPGKILKHGTRLQTGVGTTQWIDLTSSGGSGASWSSGSTSITRTNHNLVLLPSGEVMATGGTATATGDSVTMGPRRRPQLWNPDEATWYMTTSGGESLAVEPAIRDYHSTALLLPDGRVLTASGNLTRYMYRFAIYCPPYLFRSDGTSRTRPVIVNSSAIAKPGDWIDVCVGLLDGPPSFCLMSPGSSTHGFDQNQRYVPLAATTVCDYNKYRLRIPADVDSVPPGDYMVFCLNDSGVPGVARWLHVDPSYQGAIASCSTCPGGGCPYVDVNTAEGWRTENTILGRSLDGDLAYDAYRLKLTPSAADGSIRLRVRENEQEVTTLDEARLLVVDHTPGFKVMGSGNGVVAGNWTPAWRVTTARGEDITNLVNDSEGSVGWQGSSGDTVLIELDPPQVGHSAQAVQDEGGGGTFGGEPKEQDLRYDPGHGGGSARNQSAATPTLATDTDWLRQTGVIIQRPDGEGGWTEVTHWYPREYADETYVPGLGRGTTRLIFVGRHRLTSLGRLVPAASGVTVQTLTPATASHSRLGAVGTEVAAGGESTTLAPGDTVSLSFTPPAMVEGMTREYVLVTRGVYTSTVSPSRMQPRTPGLPTRFALLQNRPNPFGQATTIQFDLPMRTRVKIEIFDLFGRRVKTLTNMEWPAGYQRLEWDRRSDAGDFVRAGVCSYRISAGSFRETRKMVLLAK